MVNWAPTSHIEGKIPVIPGRMSFALYFIGKVGFVFCKLPLEDFYSYLKDQYAPKAFLLV